ncbi:MAG: PAS domain-containing protein [Balneola sp.]|nr:PAS domain-containing protein [Balneola sp.]MBO6650006.1 PAS domain-containing protein [Balneola sp.]MBO6711644.1 PAS domain-containing protein [Balneola sp.]MBO6799840.1 PAS domain-containing protein [Balneola sp.]MBO6871083.1 PAS domain-containing protein [Balneola sp.]
MSFFERISPKQIYLIAVSTLIVLIVSNQLLIHKILDEKQDDTTVINLAGRQRMLGQKIAKTVYLAENGVIDLQGLKRDVEKWALVHEGLTSGNQELGIEAIEIEEIKQLFSELEPHQVAIQESLANLSTQQDVINAIPIIQKHEASFLTKMDEIVDVFESVSNNSVRKIIWFEVGLGLFSILILGLGFSLVFKIFSKQIGVKNEELEKITSELVQAENVLEISEKIGGVVSWVFDFEKNRELYGQNLLDLYGFDSKPERITQAILKIVHPDDLEKVKRAFFKANKKRKPWKVEYRIESPTGEIKYILAIVSVIKTNHEGKIIRVIGTTQDVTESKKNEAELTNRKQKLELSLKTLQEIQEVAKIGTWEVDLQTMSAFWSDEVYRIHEVETGTPIKVEEGINFYREDYRDIIQEAINGAIENKSSWDEECILVTKTGKEIWVRAIGYPFFENENLVGLRGLFMDIDDRKRASQELSEVNEKLELSVEAGQLAIWRWDMKTNELEWNNQAYEVFGVPKDFEPTFEKFSSMIHPDDLNYVVEATQKSIETGDKFDIQFRFNKGNGDEIILSGRGDIVRDESGNPIQMIGINMDVTDRNEMVENLKRQESQLRSFVEQAPAAVAMFDMDMKYITVSNKWYEHNKIEGQSIIGKLHYDVLPQVKKRKDWLGIHKRVLAGEELSKGKDQFTRTDNSEVWISWKAIPWHNAEGGIGGMILYVSDITKEVEYTEELENEIEARTQQIRKQAENLEQVNKELESFSYSISHDLRAPLRSINGFSDILMEDYAEQLDDEGKRLMGIVKESAVTMGQLIDDILEFSRLGKKKIQKSEIDMTKLFESVCEAEADSYSDKQVDLKIDDLPNAMGDVALIKQVVVNLVSNAFKYSSKKDTIVINIGFDQSEENEAAYFIKDNGTGFKMEYHDKLFGVFNRLHSNNEYEGTGVGLAIVKRIINKHEGRI